MGVIIIGIKFGPIWVALGLNKNWPHTWLGFNNCFLKLPMGVGPLASNGPP